MEVIPLGYRTADQVIPVLKPLLDKQGSISGMQSQLIIRTTPANLAELKKVLAKLDATPRRLMITVKQDADSNRDQTTAEASGRIAAGEATVITSGSRGAGGVIEARRGGDGVRGRVDSTRSLENDRDTQSVQVLEGNSAFIRIGQSVPIPQRQIMRSVVNGQIIERYVDAVEYRDVMSGFNVLPRLSGDRVTLEISPQRDTLGNSLQPPGSINVQSASTTVSGRLGEWIEIGGVGQVLSNQQSVILGRTSTAAENNRRILVKVDEIR